MRMSAARKLQDLMLPISVERFFSEMAVRSLFAGVETLGWLRGAIDGPVHGINVERDVHYGPDADGPDARHHRLDIYRPQSRNGRAAKTAPILYVHGGGFRILSKETHATMAKILARAGYTVFNIDYRLAPEHPYPAAAEDAGRALGWITEHADELGVDMDRLVLAGESSGGNVVTALGLACCVRRDEMWARRVFDLGVRPAVVAPTCGFLQVSQLERLEDGYDLSSLERDKLLEAAHAYLPDARRRQGDEETPALLADPLLVLEEATGGRSRPERPLPAFFAAVGTRDPLLDDSVRLRRALEDHPTRCDLHVYDGELHSFHALYWREAAKDYWTRFIGFLDEEVGGEHGGVSGRTRDGELAAAE